MRLNDLRAIVAVWLVTASRHAQTIGAKSLNVTKRHAFSLADISRDPHQSQACNSAAGYCSSSHNDAMQGGSAVTVQRGNFVIAGGSGPLENLIRYGFANELLVGEPENFTHAGIEFGA
jgi:hypothetical protein